MTFAIVLAVTSITAVALLPVIFSSRVAEFATTEKNDLGQYIISVYDPPEWVRQNKDCRIISITGSPKYGYYIVYEEPKH